MNTEKEWLATLEDHREYAYRQGVIAGIVWTSVAVLIAAATYRIFGNGC